MKLSQRMYIIFRQDGNELTVYPVARACTDDSMYNAELEISERPETIAQGAEMQFETNTDGLYSLKID